MTKIKLVDEFQDQQRADLKLTMADFCRQRGICVRTFRIWVKNYDQLLLSKHDNRKKKRTVWKKALDNETDPWKKENDKSMPEEIKPLTIIKKIKTSKKQSKNQQVGANEVEKEKVVDGPLPELNARDIERICQSEY